MTTHHQTSGNIIQNTTLTCRNLLLGGMTLAVLSCASTPTIHTQSAPGLSVSEYKTFAYISPLGTDDSKYGSLLSKKLKDRTTTALTAKGFTYDETSPDMLVNFTASVKQKTDVDSMPTGFYGDPDNSRRSQHRSCRRGKRSSRRFRSFLGG
jgi:hypothetical protein